MTPSQSAGAILTESRVKFFRCTYKVVMHCELYTHCPGGIPTQVSNIWSGLEWSRCYQSMWPRWSLQHSWQFPHRGSRSRAGGEHLTGSILCIYMHVFGFCTFPWIHLIRLCKSGNVWGFPPSRKGQVPFFVYANSLAPTIKTFERSPFRSCQHPSGIFIHAHMHKWLISFHENKELIPDIQVRASVNQTAHAWTIIVLLHNDHHPYQNPVYDGVIF